MLIVPFGKICLQGATGSNRQERLPTIVTGINKAIREVVTRCIEAELEVEQDQMIKRKRHKRWKKEAETGGGKLMCQSCGSKRVNHFQRNGHYQRGLDTSWGHIELAMPQVRCECGKAIQIPNGILRPRQRVWDDLAWEIRADYGWGLSLRCIKAKEDAKLGGSMGLRTLNERVHTLAEGVPSWNERIQATFPPVVVVDGIWVTMMKRSGGVKKDAIGRKRAVKAGQRMVVLVAQGVWPTTGHQEVLTWRVAEGETEEAWGDLLFDLHQMALQVKGHIALLIGDGSPGFEAAWRRNYSEIPFQRCIFHKLQNIGRSLETPPELDRQAGGEYRKQILQEAAAIWQADDERQAQFRCDVFCTKWVSEQVKMVHTLLRDFELTLTFYQVKWEAKERGEEWPVTFLRTTSHLERENRNLRKRMRAAVLFHSQTGLQATIYQNLMLRQSLADPSLSNQWPYSIEKQLCPKINFMN